MEIRKIYINKNYTVSSCGVIRNKKGKKLKQCLKTNGRLGVSLYKDGIATNIMTHQAVYYSFHGGSTTKGMVIDHIDGNHLNNNLSNLQKITYSQNTIKGRIVLNKKSGLPLYISCDKRRLGNYYGYSRNNKRFFSSYELKDVIEFKNKFENNMQ